MADARTVLSQAMYWEPIRLRGMLQSYSPCTTKRTTVDVALQGERIGYGKNTIQVLSIRDVKRYVECYQKAAVFYDGVCRFGCS